MSGLGTEVIEDVEVLMSVRRVSRAGRYSSVLASYGHGLDLITEVVAELAFNRSTSISS